MSKQTVYVITDANGDHDSTFVVEGDIDEAHFKKYSKQLNDVGFYIDKHASKGNNSQLAQRVTHIVDEVKKWRNGESSGVKW